MSLHDEILEQPKRLSLLLNTQRSVVERIAKEIQTRDIQYIFLAARGTSDNAGRYANYVFGALNRLPLALATPSLFTYYKHPPNLKNALVIGISQSGQSPDIVSVIENGKRQGNLTLAITNSPSSPLAMAADFVIDIMAGEELAVAASKTYTAELMAIAMLSAALSNQKNMWDELGHVEAWINETLKQDQFIEESAQRYRYMEHCVVLGRGFNYSTVFEWALKLKELAYVMAEPYSFADFQHGPLALVSEGFPVFAVAAQGRVIDSILTSLIYLQKDLLAELVTITNNIQVKNLAKVSFSIPTNLPEWLSPLVSIVPAQLFAYHLTVSKGHDPNLPRTIQKITETR